MGVVAVVLCALGGAAFVGRGVWIWVRGGPLVAKNGGPAWATAGRAATFWLLIGAALLVAGLLRAGARAGVIESDSGFWLSLTPLVLICLALIFCRPRRVVGRSR
ncbi:hypothetical protein OWR29_14050 [Actinoplanes sp. Pm04-4]|uniref:Uncharacterized protein n=1 Tax=Paractinoplanes pyxinae TaxID=2997416 RepID=A0ABT4AXY6_9ACTN|nr:hypothetical protein [Actinoplanes pyxinae]MCY1139116.1 hypothetical protein [Actinoplanes pyxinae]